MITGIGMQPAVSLVTIMIAPKNLIVYSFEFYRKVLYNEKNAKIIVR
jgi:hypothetical protein